MNPERSAADIHGRDFPAGAVAFEEWASDHLAWLELKRRFEPEGNA